MAIRGCLLKSAGALFSGANLTAGAVLPWDTEIFDTAGFHSGSSSKIIIPASMNGLRGIFTGVTEFANASGSTIGLFSRIHKNGSFAYTGSAGAARNSTGGNGQSTSSHWTQISTAPVLLTTGDEWELHARVSTDTTVDVTTKSSFGLYVIGNAHVDIRCLAKLNAAQAAQNFQTPAAISFDGADVYDTHAIHGAGAPTKLIVPAAADGKYGVLNVSAQASSMATVSHSLAISRGGSLTYDGFGGNSGLNANFTFGFLTAQTQVHLLTAGHEYEALLWLDDSSVTLEKVHAGTGTPDVTMFGLWVYG